MYFLSNLQSIRCSNLLILCFKFIRFWSNATNEMSLLERMTQENKVREAWLEGVIYPIPDDDFAVMVAAMEWPKRIRTILQVHQKRIQDEYDHYEVAFKKKRNEFQALLDR